ncbi:hypothetical protein PJN90_00105 [Mycobacterium kansasii]
MSARDPGADGAVSRRLLQLVMWNMVVAPAPPGMGLLPQLSELPSEVSSAVGLIGTVASAETPAEAGGHGTNHDRRRRPRRQRRKTAQAAPHNDRR